MGSSVERFQNSQWKKLEELSFSKRAVISLVGSGSVLDIGCGDGQLLEILNKRGMFGVGVDISSVAVGICCKERGLDCRQMDITEPLPFGDGSFDNVILTDVLEHIFQPQMLLKEAGRVCGKNLFVSVPNFSSLPARLQVLFGRVPENNTPRDGHVYWMNYKVLNNLLSRSGFVLEEAVFNTFWEKIPIIGFVMNFLKKIRPSLFALSFVVKARKVGDVKN